MAKIKRIKLPAVNDHYDLVDVGAVRFDESQSLTDDQKSQARTNIGVPTVPAISTDVASDATSDTKTVSPKAVKSYVDDRVSSTYKASGSCTFANLPALESSKLGYVYNVTDAFTTTSDFLEGAGHKHSAGTNVVIVKSDNVYKYDVLSGFVDLSGYVQTTRKVNNKALSADITLTASDVGAAATNHTHDNYVPTTRKVNNKALSSDITLTASDVSAVPTTRTINEKALSSNITLTAEDVAAVPTTRTINSKSLGSNVTLTASDVGAASSNHTHTYSSLTNKPTISRGQVKMPTGIHDTVTVPFTVKNSANLLVYKDGLLLAPTENYTVSGNVVTFVDFHAYLNDVFDFVEFNL